MNLHGQGVHVFQKVGEVWEQLTDFRIEVDIPRQGVYSDPIGWENRRDPGVRFGLSPVQTV